LQLPQQWRDQAQWRGQASAQQHQQQQHHKQLPENHMTVAIQQEVAGPDQMVTKYQHPWACLNNAGLTFARKLGCSEWPGVPPHTQTILARTGASQWRKQHQQQ